MLIISLIVVLVLSLAFNLVLMVKFFSRKNGKLHLENNNKELQDKLADMTIFKQNVLENIPVSIVVLDKQGEVILTNSYFNKIVPWYDPKIGLNLLKSNTIKSAGLAHKYANVLEKGIAFSQKNVLLTAPKPHYSYYMNFEVVPLKNSKDEVIGALSIGQEITGLIKAKDNLEKANQQLNEDVRKRTEEFYQINNQLADKIDFYEKIFELITANIKKSLTHFCKEPELVTAQDKAEKDNISLIFNDFIFLNQINKNDLSLNFEKISLGNYLAGVLGQFNPKMEFENLANSQQVLIDKEKIDYILKGFYDYFKDTISHGRAVLSKKGNQLNLDLDFFLESEDQSPKEQDNFFWDIRLLLFKEIVNLHKGVLTENIANDKMSFNIKFLVNNF